MKERPILMTPENAQKCHDGTKTQTRRVIKPQPLSISWFEHQNGWCARVREDTGSAEHPAYIMVPCPYGVVGDRLWVREPWAWPGEEFHLYKGSSADARIVEEWKKDPNCCQVKWTPSIHMPRFVCRTVLEITNVRVERVQDISRVDAVAEGFVGEPCLPIHPVDWYRDLWETINGKGSWERNDWVWVLMFKKVA